jgi:transposase
MTAPAATDPLPDDPPALRVMVRELADALADARKEIDALRARLDQLLRRLYGPRSERAADGPATPADTAASPPPPDPGGDGSARPTRRGHGRRRLPADLPRHRVEHDLTDGEKACPGCHARRVRIGEEVSERLDYRPASLFVVEHVRPKYACLSCRGHVAVPPLPPEPLPKGMAAPGLLAQVVTSKFADHLPLFRQARILGRHGADLHRSTLGDWLAGCAAVLRPIYDAMCQSVRGSKVVHTDDTPVPVLDRDRDRTRTGRIWVYVGDPAHPYTVYDATPSRARDGPQAFLKDFRGFVQADAFGGYDGLYATGATEVACWAHARRKFVDARATDPARCDHALAAIRALYAVERQARGVRSDKRLSLRQRESVPVLRELGEWLTATRRAVLPKSPLAQAVTYALNQWAALNRYAADGDLAIDNNPAERALRGVAVGRKNWLFWGSDAGGRTAAVLTSLTATCARHGIDPWAYLSDVLARLPSLPPARIGELLPDTWAAARRTSS